MLLPQGPLLGEIDIIHLLFGAKGLVLVVAILLVASIFTTVFVILYKLIHISQAQSQSISFLDRFWESKRLDDIYRVAEQLKHSPLAAMFRAGYIELSKVKKGQAESTSPIKGAAMNAGNPRYLFIKHLRLDDADICNGCGNRPHQYTFSCKRACRYCP